ncbi:AlpA family phage regulatory protein [Roseibacterium sp. SDUM158017]|uniref:helix-turn-helix transcriptional regulator n=1 Tax=Roseicyclus salinarum TaxID=3036773 RepID=UPI00241503FE|nr:AlpA family phage regulatory protein [Roseibacterium sp. SDUM158017]MDG4647920.1 AlpA family phage regulatory protein [Roseibacterium sp. SDUM158017]
MATDRLLRRREVEAMTGLSRSSLYAAMAEGRFPRPVRIGLKAVAWRSREIAEWIEARQEAA